MNDPAFTKEVLEGDIHQLNADIIGCTRGQAKRFIFAFLYGAGPTKLAGYIGKDVEETKKSINRYKKRLPKLDKLIQKMQKDVQEKSYIIGLDSRKVMLNKQEQHKALNYLIQSAEAIIMKATVVMLDERLKEAGIEFNHLLFYHDEHTIETTPDKAEQAKEIIMECFAEAPKQYGIPFMTCGDCKIGHDYFEVH
jgi:DNA polymerase I-like protein with 3'-5' exonuclease and polymerase domains